MRTKLLISLVAVLFVSVLYLLYLNFTKKPEIVYTPPTGNLTVPTTSPAVADLTANWKMYNITPDPTLGYVSYQLNLPIVWKQIEHSSNFQGTETFQSQQNVYQLTIEEKPNSATNLRELTGLSYDVDTLMIDGQLAAKVQPRAGSENNFMILFFSPNKKLSFTITLETPRDGSKISEGEILFSQILSTFKFTDSNTTLYPADADSPAAGTCIDVPNSHLVSVDIGPDNVPNPRCTKVNGSQVLTIVNNSYNPVTITQTNPKTTLNPGQSYHFTAALDDFLARGIHHIAGAEIWLQ
jgi:hypothetical protein